MTEVFRILERFKIAGRGVVYIIKNYAKINIRIGDIMYDLQGNRFKVKGIEGFRRITESIGSEDMSCGIMFEFMDGVEAQGSVLVRSLEEVNFLFCNHPLYPWKVDEDYEEEYQAAGLIHSCALFSYEDLQLEKLSLYGEEISGLTIYRGWMMKPEKYRLLYNLLEERSIILINTPEEYEQYHMLPGWYDDFKEYTAESIWEDKGSLESALTLTKTAVGSYIVKDYVKSRKHEWYDACFIQNVADKENTGKIIENFINRQGSDLVGGVVLRRFEKLRQAGFHEKSGMPISEEYRVFVYAGKILSLDHYWNKNEAVNISENEWAWIESIVRKVKSNFVTIDLARREDGSLIIMEFGDGQVSGLQEITAEDFYRAFDTREDSVMIEDVFPKEAMVLAGDPMSDKTVDEIRQDIAAITTTQELVDIYVNVHNKFWFIEDDIYDYEEGTDKYNEAYAVVDIWDEIMDELDRMVMKAAEEERLLAEKQPDSGAVKQLEVFMAKYGYCNGCGWWVKIEE